MNCGSPLAVRPDETGGARTAPHVYEAPPRPAPPQYYVPVVAPVQYYRPKPPSRSSLILAALGKAMCYLGAFAGIQGILLVAWMLPSLVKSAVSGAFDTPDGIYKAVWGALGDIHTVMIISAVVSIAFLWVFFRTRRKRLAREIYLRPLPRERGERAAGACVRWIPAIIAFGVAAQFAVGIALYYIVPESMMNDFSESQSILANGPLWLQILDIAVFTPVIEEIFFRGLIFSRLRRAMPFWWAAAVSSVIFGAMHGHVISLVYATLLGLLMAMLFERTGTLISTVFFHFAFNMTSFVPLPEDDTALLFIMCAAALAAVCLGAYLFAFTPKAENVFVAQEKPARTPAQQYAPYSYMPVYAAPYAPAAPVTIPTAPNYGANIAPAAPLAPDSGAYDAPSAQNNGTDIAPAAADNGINHATAASDGSCFEPSAADDATEAPDGGANNAPPAHDENNSPDKTPEEL